MERNSRTRDSSKQQGTRNWVANDNRKKVSFERKDSNRNRNKESMSSREDGSQVQTEQPAYRNYFEDILPESIKSNTIDTVETTEAQIYTKNGLKISIIHCSEKQKEKIEDSPERGDDKEASSTQVEVSSKGNPSIVDDHQSKLSIEEQKKQKGEWRKKTDSEKKPTEKGGRERRNENRKRNEESYVPKERKQRETNSGQRKQQPQWREKDDPNQVVRKIEKRPPSEPAPLQERSYRNETSQNNVVTSQEKNAAMFMMYSKAKNQTERAHTDNVMNSNPSNKDISEAIFGFGSEFDDNELVLVPRTRGGFSYAKVMKKMAKSNCYFDPSNEHTNIVYRVVYNAGGKSLYKDLPVPYIGKLKDAATPALANEMLEESQTQERQIGQKPSPKDLQTIILSPQCSFGENEIILVPRSSGGFTYGRLVKEIVQNCKLTLEPAQAHPLAAWKIVVSEGPNGVTRKELFAACIGKIQLFTSNATAAEVNIRKVLTIQGSHVDPILFKKESEFNPEAALEKNKKKDSRRGRIRHRKNARKPQERYEKKGSKKEESSEDEEYPMWGSESSSEGEEVAPLTQANLPVSPEHAANLSQNSPPANPPVELKVGSPVKKPAQAPAQAHAPVNPSNPHQIGGLLAVDKKELLKQLMGPSTFSRKNKHIIIIDGPNVAMKHGKDTEYSAEGIKIVLDFWNSKGHDAICFLPQHYIKRKPQTGPTTLLEYLPKINNIQLVQKLIDEARVVLTPPQDYDDSYCIDYAMQHNCCIVTNDRYADHVDKLAQKNDSHKGDIWKWLRDHCISYTFVRDEFMPVRKSLGDFYGLIMVVLRSPAQLGLRCVIVDCYCGLGTSPCTVDIVAA